MPQAAQQTQQNVLERIMNRFQSRKTKGNPPKNQIQDPQQQNPQHQQQRPQNQPQNKQNKQQQQQQQQDSQEENQPLDVLSLYSGLYDEEDAETKKAKQPPRFVLTAEKVQEAAGKLDFTTGLPDEIAQKLQSGEAIDGKTMLAAINLAGRNAYATAIQHSVALTDKYVESRVSHERNGLPSLIRTHLAKTKAVSGINLDNPVVKEHMEMISTRISDRFPDATEDEVATLSKEYFIEMAKAINPQAFQLPQPGQDKNKRGENEVDVQDWSTYLGTESQDDPSKSQQGQTSQGGQS